MAADIETKFGFSAGKPNVLFEGLYLLTTASFPFYDVSRDGQRFLMLKPNEQQAQAATQINRGAELVRGVEAEGPSEVTGL